MSHSISIIIPCYNAQDTVGQTLQALQALDLRAPVEIIAVDDGSTDNTPQLIRSFSDVKYLRQNNAGPAAARNLGAQEAQGDILFFTDADCVPRRDWVRHMIIHFADETIGAVCGSYGIANPNNLLARCVYQEISYRHKHLLPRFPKVFGSYNVAIRRELFREVGGFNASYRHASGEDNDLSYKILKAGSKIFFEPAGLVDHHHPQILGKYLKEQYRHGMWRVKMYLSYPRMARGDDYTFWKDIFEIPAGMLMIVLALLGMMGFPTLGFSAFLAAAFVLSVELYWAAKMTVLCKESLYLAGVMMLRIFARMAGFLAGLIRFLPAQILKSS